MPSKPALLGTGWADIAEFQSGVISRGQLLGLGLSHAQSKSYLTAGRWQTLLPGTYATFTGPVGTHSRIWASILYAGHGSAASNGTALWLWKVQDDSPVVIDIVVPESRRVSPQPGLRVHRRRALNHIGITPDPSFSSTTSPARRRGRP